MATLTISLDGVEAGEKDAGICLQPKGMLRTKRGENHCCTQNTARANHNSQPCART
jgi:hypothetical protein